MILFMRHLHILSLILLMARMEFTDHQKRKFQSKKNEFDIILEKNDLVILFFLYSVFFFNLQNF